MRTTGWRAVDAGRSAWVARRLLPVDPGEPARVAALVPAGFAAYTRLRHAASPGSLPVEELAVLCDVLATHTQAAEACTFDLGEDWPGWRAPWPGGPGDPRGAGRLLAAPLAEAVPLGYSDAPGRWWARSPAAFWPDDRAWFVVTDAGLDDTFVGGSVALREDLLAVTGLDAWPARATDPTRE